MMALVGARTSAGETVAVGGQMRVLISCADRPGVVAAVSRFLFESGANIVRSDQYSTDPEGGAFFLRMEFTPTADGRDGLAQRFGRAVAEPFGMTWRLWDSAERKRVTVFVSRNDHCLQDLLWRWRRDELEADIKLVASNWPDLRGDVEAFRLPYHHIPVPADGKPQAEAALLEPATRVGRARGSGLLHADPLR